MIFLISSRNTPKYNMNLIISLKLLVSLSSKITLLMTHTFKLNIILSLPNNLLFNNNLIKHSHSILKHSINLIFKIHSIITNKIHLYSCFILSLNSMYSPYKLVYSNTFNLNKKEALVIYR